VAGRQAHQSERLAQGAAVKRATITIKTLAGRVRTPWAMLCAAASLLLVPRRKVTFTFALDGSELDMPGETVEDCARIALAAGLLVVYGSVVLDVR
jgi:hypothetical protein